MGMSPFRLPDTLAVVVSRKYRDPTPVVPDF